MVERRELEARFLLRSDHSQRHLVDAYIVYCSIQLGFFILGFDHKFHGRITGRELVDSFGVRTEIEASSPSSHSCIILGEFRYNGIFNSNA
jgi:hypothetical protein